MRYTNITKNRRKPVARFLNPEELERLGAALDRHRDEHPWPVAAIRLLTLTGARLSEVLNFNWGEIGDLAQDGASARLEDSKTGPRTVWLGPEAVRLLAGLPRREDGGRVFPDDLTSDRLYTFWCGIREEAGLPGLRIHDARHTWASQGVMNGVGLTTVGRLLGHRKRRTTAIYAHLDDAALHDAAAQAAGVIAQAMGYKAEPPPVQDETDGDRDSSVLASSGAGEAPALPPDLRSPFWLKAGRERPDTAQPEPAPGDPDRHPVSQRLDDGPGAECTEAVEKEYRNSRGPIRI